MMRYSWHSLAVRIETIRFVLTIPPGNEPIMNDVLEYSAVFAKPSLKHSTPANEIVSHFSAHIVPYLNFKGLRGRVEPFLKILRYRDS